MFNLPTFPEEETEEKLGIIILILLLIINYYYIRCPSLEEDQESHISTIFLDSRFQVCYIIIENVT